MEKVSKIWHVGLALTVLLLLVARLWLHRTAAEGVKPFETCASWLESRVGGRVAALFHAQATIDENRRLRDEISRLRVDAMLLEEVAAENASLREQASIPRGSGLRAERCVILSRGGSAGWWRSICLGKGRSSGIAPGDAVVAPEGLVGHVASVTDTTADVRLITDPASRISCALDSANGNPLRGILQGCGWNSHGHDVPEFLYVAEPMRLDYLPLGGAETQIVDSRYDAAAPQIIDNRYQITDNRYADTRHPTLDTRNNPTTRPLDHPTTRPLDHPTTRPLDHPTTRPLDHPTTRPPDHQTTGPSARAMVRTSGLSATIPGGIPVGWLVGTGVDPDGLYMTGTIIPAVDFANLGAVFVLTNPDGRE